MILKIFKIFVFLFSFFYFTICVPENRCRTCPSLSDLSELEPTFKDDCSCQNFTFFDEKANRCVRFVLCTEVKKVLDEIATAIERYFNKGPEVLREIVEGNTEDIVFKILSEVSLFNSTDLEEMQESTEYEIVTDVLDENLGSVFHKYFAFLKNIFNPFLMKSKSVKSKCGENQTCAIQFLLSKNEKKWKKILTGLGPDLAKGLAGVNGGLKDAIDSQCGPDECDKLKKFLILYQGIKEELAFECGIWSEKMIKLFSDFSTSDYLNNDPTKTIKNKKL